MPDSPITLEAGRLALRRPELGGFLMVEVEELDPEGNVWPAGFYTEYAFGHADDFLPVLKPGDVVPAGSRVREVFTCAEWDVQPDEVAFVVPRNDGRAVALLRWGPEDA